MPNNESEDELNPVTRNNDSDHDILNEEILYYK